MAFQPLTKFTKKLFARMAARGPTPEEVAREKREAERRARKAQEDAAYKALAAENRAPAEGWEG
jgi:hypothetical protein